MKQVGIISVEQHDAFALASGDSNPAHMSAAFARRTVAGGRIVHGMHLVLRALDVWCEGAGCLELRACEVRFHAPVLVDREPELEFEITPSDEGCAFRVSSGHRLHAEGRFEARRVAGGGESRVVDADSGSPVADADVHDIDELSVGMAADWAVRLDEVFVKRMIAIAPCATRAVDQRHLAILCAASAVAGMKLPGQQCVLNDVALTFPVSLQRARSGADRPLMIHATITRRSRAARMIRVAMTATDPETGAEIASGEYGAIVAAPSAKVAQDAIERLVDGRAELRAAYAGRSVLVTGGSRGIGELIVRALCVLGARVVFTHSGAAASDAEALARETGARAAVWRIPGGEAGCRAGDNAPLPGPNVPIDILIHCAAPRIRKDSDRDTKESVPDAFGIAALVDGLGNHINEGALVAGVSTVMIDAPEPEFRLYTQEKLEMEAWLENRARADATNPRVTTAALRLPRFESDQTRDASGRSSGVDPSSLVIPILDSLAARVGTEGFSIIRITPEMRAARTS